VAVPAWKRLNLVRANELLTLAQTAIRDAQVVEISAWTRLMATYDAAVCVLAVLARSEIPPRERDDVLDKLLGQAQLTTDTTQHLQALDRCYRVELRGEAIVTHAEVNRVLRCVERLWEEAQLQASAAQSSDQIK
jgi:hypothetical protein